MEQLSKYDWPKTLQVVDGYDSKEVPIPCTENLEFIMEKFNEIISHVNGDQK